MTKENLSILELFNEKRFLNLVAAYLKDKKINVKLTDWSNNVQSSLSFNEPSIENLSSKLFPNKLKNLQGLPMDVKLSHEPDHDEYYWIGVLINKLTYFVDIIVEKLNVTVSYSQAPQELETAGYCNVDIYALHQLGLTGKFDIFLSTKLFGDLITYNAREYCYIVTLPKRTTIYEKILILPLDGSCWFWLAIVMLVSTLIWKLYGLLEGKKYHWTFMFGMFSFFVGQSVEIKT